MNLGFTLIELAVVISIVAVMVAMVLPRVWHWQREARIGNLNYTRGAVHSAAMLVHLAVLSRKGQVDNEPCPAGGGTADNRPVGRGSLCTEAGLVQTQHGYPASVPPGATLPGILRAAEIEHGYLLSVAGPVTTFARADAPTPAQCSFTYTEPLVARTAASISTTAISGC